MPRHQPKVAVESAEPAPVKRRAPKAKVVAAEVPAESAPAPVKRARKVAAAEPAEVATLKAARKPPSEAQLVNRKRFAEQAAMIRQLRAEDPKLSQKEAKAKAFAKAK